MPYIKQRFIQLVLLAVGLWAYWIPLQNIVQNWFSNPDYSHGFLVPLICLAILYIRRDSLPELASSMSLWGLGLLVLAGLFRYVSGRLYLPELDAWSLPIWIGGWVWLCCGWRYFRWAAPAVGFLFFAMPLPATIEVLLSTPLQKLAAGCSAWTLRLLAQPAIADGTVILLDGHQFEVERACSGLRMFFGILALAVAAITIAKPGLKKSLLLLAAVVPVSVIANVARIDATALLARYWSGEISERFSHDFAAVAMVPLAAAMFWGVLCVLNLASRRFSENKAAGAAWGMRWGLAAALLIVAVLFTQRYFENRALITLKRTAERYEAEGNFASAATYYSRYLSIVPDDVDAAIQLAEAAHRTSRANGELLRTAQLYLRAWKLAPQRTELAVSAAQLATQIREYRLALDVYGKLQSHQGNRSQLSQNDVDKLYAVALVDYLRWERGRADVTWHDAVKVLSRVVDSGDYEVWHAVVLANAIMISNLDANMKHDAGDACRVLEKLVVDQAGHPLAWLAKYEFERNHQNCAGADPEESLRNALQLAARSTGFEAARVYYVAAQGSLQKEDPAAAEEYLKQAIAAQPDFYLPHLALAKVYLAREEVNSNEMAIAALEAGMNNMQDTELSLLVPLASLFARTGQFDKAEDLVVPLEQLAPKVSEEERGAVLGSIALVRARIAAEKRSPRHALQLLVPVLQSPNRERIQSRYPRMYAEIWTLYGDLCTSFGQWDVAISSYRQAIRLNPGFDALRLQLANLATRTGNLPLAEEQLLGVVDSSQDAQRNAYVALANVELRRQQQLPERKRNWPAVTDALENAAKSGAPRDVLEVIAAEALIAQGRSDEAARRLEDALKQNSNSASLWQSYAALKQESGDGEAALSAAEKYRELANDRSQATIFQSRLLAGCDRIDAAIAVLQKELEIETSPLKQGRLFIELSHTHLRNGDTSAAVDILETAHERLVQNSNVVDEAARLAWLRQDWARLATYVAWLKDIEGSQGTEWRAYQAQILLADLTTESDPRFEQVIDLVQFIRENRPDWPKSHFLVGELALIQGELDAALASYQRAWQLGSRNILLADRIIDIYTRTNRFAEAQRFVSQASDMLEFSPQLFDRAVRYYARGTEQQQALTLAKSWVADRPEDADSQMRLGRVLMMLADGQDEQQKAAVLSEAESAFRKAVDNAPSDIRTWNACVLFYDRVLGSRENALATLRDLTATVSLSRRQKSFVLAQLYQQMNLVDQARSSYWNAVTLSCETSDVQSIEVLTRAARFYASQSPQLAEAIARRVLSIQPENNAARLVLANLLINSRDAASVQEAGRILKQDTAGQREDVPLPVIRTRIRYLSELGTAKALTQAIRLAEGILDKNQDDLQGLAKLYEKSNRVAAAFAILDDLGNRAAPRAQDLTEYLRFWQQHFLSSPEKDGQIPFSGGAQKIYAKLAKSPDLLGEFVRWKVREIKAAKPDSTLAADDLDALVNEIRATPAITSSSTPQEQQLLLTRILSTAIQENQPRLAARLSENCFAALSKEAVSRSLIEALILNRATAHSQQSEIDQCLASMPEADNALIQLLGDLRFLQGRYNDAAQLYRRVLSSAPDSTLAQNNLALAIAEESSPSQDARDILQSALERLPNNPRLIDSLATVELIAGNADVAIERLRPLTDEEVADASVWLHLAEAHRQVGDMEYARDAFQRALGLGIEGQLLSMRDQKWLRDLSNCFECSMLTKGST